MVYKGILSSLSTMLRTSLCLEQSLEQKHQLLNGPQRVKKPLQLTIDITESQSWRGPCRPPSQLEAGNLEVDQGLATFFCRRAIHQVHQ